MHLGGGAEIKNVIGGTSGNNLVFNGLQRAPTWFVAVPTKRESSAMSFDTEGKIVSVYVDDNGDAKVLYNYKLSGGQVKGQIQSQAAKVVYENGTLTINQKIGSTNYPFTPTEWTLYYV